MKEKCFKKLEDTVEHYLNNNCNDVDNQIISLLNGIVVVEKDNTSAEIIYDQLKESYFDTDEATTNFILNLYNMDKSALDTYIDIYLEQAYESEINDSDINNKIIELNDILASINPEYTILLEEKRNNINI